MADFGRSQAHPPLGLIVNVLSQRDLAGQPVEVVGSAVPITWLDIYEGYRKHGASAGTALATLAFFAFFGEGLQYYGIA